MPDYIEELKDLLEQQGEAFQEFKAGSESRVKELEEQIVELAKKANRPGAPTSGIDRESREIMSAFLRDGETKDLVRARKDVKSGTVVSDPGGGYLVPTQVDDTIGTIRTNSNPMRQMCRVIKPETPDYKKVVSVTRAGSGWVGETEARPETDTPELSVLKPIWGGLYASPAATQDLIEDAESDIEQWFQDEVTQAFVEQEGDAFVTGNGINKPRGFLTYPTATTVDATRAFGTIQYIASGNAGALPDDTDEFYDIIYSLNRKYRQNAVWTCNSLTLASISKMKDGDGNSLWRPGLESGQPDRFMGYPIIDNEFMPDISSDTYPLAFGDFKAGYWIFDRPTTVLRDPFTSKPFVLFYTSCRVGSMLANSEAIKLMKASAS